MHMPHAVDGVNEGRARGTGEADTKFGTPSEEHEEETQLSPRALRPSVLPDGDGRFRWPHMMPNPTTTD